MCQGLQEITSHISVREHSREKYVYYDALIHDLLYHSLALRISMNVGSEVIIIIL